MSDKKCVICRMIFSEGTNKPEHILLNALGGKKRTRGSICSNCNQRSGNSIDRALAEQIEPFRNLANWKAGDGDDAPTIIAADTVTGERLNIKPDGSVDDRKVVMIVENVDGGIRFSGGISTYERVAAMIPNIAKMLGTTEDVVIDKITQNGLKVQVRRPPVVKFNLDASEPRLMASTCKMLFVLWSEKVGNTSASADHYNITADYLNQSMRSGAIKIPRFGKINARMPTGFNLPPGTDWGGCWNLLHVKSDSAGLVRGWFRLYNSINYCWDLGVDKNNPNQAISLISNPDTLEWTLVNDLNLSFSLESLFSAPVDAGEFESATSRLVAYVYRRHQMCVLEKTINDALEEAGSNASGELGNEQAVKAARDIAEAVVAERFNLNYEKTITPNQAKRIISKKK